MNGNERPIGQTVLEDPENLRYWGILAEASGADKTEVLKLSRELFGDLNLPSDPHEATVAVLRRLVSEGFEYDDSIFCVQDVLSKKAGNCLGLNLILGAGLREKGFYPEYKILINPRSAMDELEKELLSEYQTGTHFAFEQPKLPRVSEIKHKDKRYNFTPLDHPVVWLNGQGLDLTSLPAENVVIEVIAERVVDMKFEEVAGLIYYERAKKVPLVDKSALEEKKRLLEKSLQVSPDYSEAWYLLWQIAEKLSDGELANKCLQRYRAIDSDDSESHYTRFLLDHDKKGLDRALELYPTHIKAWILRQLLNSSDVKSRRFDFAVAAWCVANSNYLDLGDFYREFRVAFVELFGEDKLKQVLI